MLTKLLSLLPNRLLVWLSKWAERRAIRKLGGVPIAWIIYKPWESKPNVHLNIHPDIKHDYRIKQSMGSIADHLREHYSDKWERDDKNE